MPKGVEHIDMMAVIDDGGVVRKSVMPKGVEHQFDDMLYTKEGGCGNL